MLKTKKRTLILSLFSIVMAIALAFGVKSFAPSKAVYASDEHKHCLCGSASCTKTLHDDTLIWTAWDGITDLTTAGNYYLAENVEGGVVEQNVVVSADVNLCLNGKTLNLGAYGLTVNQDKTLNICDCVGGGVINAARSKNVRVHPVIGTIELAGRLNVYGGTLTHTRNDTSMSEYLCAVKVDAQGELNVFGGTITGQSSLSIYNLGKVVIDGGSVTSQIYNGYTYNNQPYTIVQTSVNPATLTLKSGEITYNKAIINAGTINVEGGSITSASGNAVVLYFYGVLNVSGGTVSSEKSTCVMMETFRYDNYTSYSAEGSINVSGGTITTSADRSGSYYCYAIDGRNLHISGGTVSNTNPNTTYAINLKGDLYLSGTPNISIVNKDGHHILYNGTHIYANDGKATPTYYEGEPLKLNTMWSISGMAYEAVVHGLKNEAHGEKFILTDYQNNIFKYENNQLFLMPEHPHCVGACNSCTDPTHKINPENGFSYNYIHSQKNNNAINFERYSYENNLPDESSSTKYLDCNVNTIYEKNKTSGTAFLCLNGHDVDGHNLETVSGGVLAITDCTGEGSIKGLVIAEGGTLRVYSGRIGEITVQNGANLLLFGGIYAQKIDSATLPAGYSWVENKDNATKAQYPFKVAAVSTYVVQHYFENLEGEYILDVNTTQNLYDATASIVTATHLTGIAGFEANLGHAESFTSSVILSDGSLVLKLYYARTVHTVTVAINNSAYGTANKTVLQNVKYGTQITVNGNVLTVGDETITVTASAQTDTNSYYFVNITGGNNVVDGDQSFTANFITRVRVDKPSADNTSFIYDGTEKTYNIDANARYVVYGNKQTQSGAYQVIVRLVDKNESEWEDGTNSDLVYEFIIKASQQSYVDENSIDNTKPSVIVSAPNGMAPDIALVVVDKTQDQTVIAKLPTEKKFVVEKIYDISLERNGDNVQVSEVGGLITIKILISEELKAEDIKLYHIHGDEKGVEIKRGKAGTVNEYVIEGDYAIITIDRLSEFAFVKEQAENNWWIWLVGAIIIIAIIIIIFVSTIKRRKAKKLALCEEDVNDSSVSFEEQESKQKD